VKIIDGSQKDNTKKDFYEFDSDEESTGCDSMELEAARYLSNAKTLECLHIPATATSRTRGIVKDV